MSAPTQAPKVLNVAVVGCGEVAQCVHLPNLSIDHERFRVTALCDISVQSLELCSKRFHVPDVYTSVPEMLASTTPIDVVLVLTADQFHTEHVIASANAGKHVLIEKPMAQTEAEADAIERARVDNGVVVFVGYMRRYATALERLKDAIKGKEIKYVRVRDIIGDNKHFTSQSGMHLHYFRDFPPGAGSELTARKHANIQTNLGPGAHESDPYNLHGISLLTTLGCHDLSAMRDVIGMPRRCIASTRSRDADGCSWWWTVLFDYGGFKAHFEMAIDQVAFFDAHIEVYTNDSRVKIQYDTPYVKGLPIKLTIQSQLPNGDYSEQVIRPTYTDPYVLELDEFYQAVVHGKEYKTTPLDAKQDTILANMVMKALVE